MSGNRLATILIYAGLVLLTLTAYEPIRRNEFVTFDDYQYIIENSNVKDGFSLHSLKWAFTTGYAGNWHPLTWISHILDCELFGLNPLWHHLHSVLLHIASTLLLFYLLRKTTGALWASAFVAAVFALHPLHVESVAWAAERKDVLSGFFFFLTIATYIRYVERPGVLRYLVVFVIYCLGLMAKPMLVTLPFVLLLVDYWPLNRFLNSKFSILNLLLEKSPLMALAFISSVITFVAQKAGGAISGTEVIPIGSRVGNALVAYVAYIGKTFWPAKLAVFYPHPTAYLASHEIALAVVVLSIITVIAIPTARRGYFVVGWLCYLGTLVPVIGLVQVGAQAMADRYTYLPSVGLTIGVAWLAADILGRRRIGKIVLGFAIAVIIAALLICTRVQLGYWRNSIALYEHALAVTENNYKMHQNLGYALTKTNRADEAIIQYRKALVLTPDDAEIHYYLAEALRSRGKIDEAIDEYRQTIRLKPNHTDALNNLGYALISQGQFNEAMAYFEQAIRVKSDWPLPMTGLAQILAAHPDASIRDPRRAVELAERANTLAGSPNATILDTVAIAYAAAGRFEDALIAAQQALELAITDKNETLAASIAKRIELYKEGKPYLVNLPPQQAEPTGKHKQWAQRIELPGVPNFHKVSDELYRGAQPTDEGMLELAKLGIRTVINLRAFHSDRDEIADANLGYEHLYTKPWHPEDEDVVRFLRIVTDLNRAPVFVHCQRGADRTGTMCAIYRIAVQGWPKEEAIAEMTSGGFGFFDGWQNLVNYIQNLDIDRIKQDAGMKK